MATHGNVIDAQISVDLTQGVQQVKGCFRLTLEAGFQSGGGLV
jgi:hypothetical protein